MNYRGFEINENGFVQAEKPNVRVLYAKLQVAVSHTYDDSPDRLPFQRTKEQTIKDIKCEIDNWYSRCDEETKPKQDA